MKKSGLARSRKPFKVMVTAVVSSFVCWLPYHLCHGLLLYENALLVSFTSTFLLIYTLLTCFNTCCIPVLYIFVGEMFWQVLRMSLMTLVKAAFIDDLGSEAPEPSGKQGTEVEGPELEMD